MEDAAARADIFCTATGNVDVITRRPHRRKKMKDLPRHHYRDISHFDSENPGGGTEEN